MRSNGTVDQKNVRASIIKELKDGGNGYLEKLMDTFQKKSDEYIEGYTSGIQDKQRALNIASGFDVGIKEHENKLQVLRKKIESQVTFDRSWLVGDQVSIKSATTEKDKANIEIFEATLSQIVSELVDLNTKHMKKGTAVSNFCTEAIKVEEKPMEPETQSIDSGIVDDDWFVRAWQAVKSGGEGVASAIDAMISKGVEYFGIEGFKSPVVTKTSDNRINVRCPQAETAGSALKKFVEAGESVVNCDLKSKAYDANGQQVELKGEALKTFLLEMFKKLAPKEDFGAEVTPEDDPLYAEIDVNFTLNLSQNGKDLIVLDRAKMVDFAYGLDDVNDLDSNMGLMDLAKKVGIVENMSNVSDEVYGVDISTKSAENIVNDQLEDPSNEESDDYAHMDHNRYDHIQR